MDYTNWTVMGRVVDTPEIIKTKGGTVVKISVATNKTIGGEEQVSFWNIEAWDAIGERIQKFEKGQLGFFTGEMTQRKYPAKDENGEPIAKQDGTPKMLTATTFRCWNSRYLTKSEKETQK